MSNSDIKITSGKDLNTFLKILAEESVRSAYSTISEQEDPYQNKFQKTIKSDIGKLSSIFEQEDEEAEEEVEVDEVEEEPEKVDASVSLDTVEKAINKLRSGRSLGDSSIEPNVSAYYDTLDDNERKALKAFMTSFAGILTGELEGSEAFDPSDAPFNITMTSGQSTEEQLEPKAVEDDEEVEEEEVETAEEPAEEAPIKIAESQDYTSVRRKIRRLMR